MKTELIDFIKLADADTFLYFADIDYVCVEKFRELVLNKAGRTKNAVLIIETDGGDPDAAYRLSSCLQNNYEKFKVYVFGRCKSAGTLAVLGAKEIVFGKSGELGPLDIQLSKRDDLFQRQSGLDIFQAIALLKSFAFDTFESSFISIVAKSGGSISSKLAAEVATNLSVGLFNPMTAQIDPERLGELQRAINIANAYGERLDAGNLKPQALNELVQGYPSHSFVIDFKEASGLFRNVREVNEIEAAAGQIINKLTASNDGVLIQDLSDIISMLPDEETQENVEEPQKSRKIREQKDTRAPQRDAAGDVDVTATDNPDSGSSRSKGRRKSS